MVPVKREDLFKFIKERYPIKTSLPISAVLFWGSALCCGLYDPLSICVGIITSFLALFILRALDDISDIDLDRARGLKRGLVTGEISTKGLKIWALLALLSVFLLNPKPLAFFIIVCLCLFYLAYFKLKRAINPALLPFFTNVIFGAIPLYAWSMAREASLEGTLFLMLFLWTGACAHDFSHDVHALDETPQHIETPSVILGPKGCARLSAILYALSAAFGLSAWFLLRPGAGFLVALMATSALVAYLLAPFMAHPDKERAKKFYIWGFVFFTLPLLATIIEKLLLKLEG
ncbi:MAG: UbiA family prenyltransferase [Thermodesulfobacteria bacterium]|nr:UbiA family prenyltransferase [Thermodesulfobacteriota bacterium]